MKKSYLMGALVLCMGLTFAACREDETVKVIPEGTSEVNIDVDNTDITAENLKNWTAYAEQTALLLKKDAETLYAAWNESYKGKEAFATQFKNGTNSAYPNAKACVEQIIDGCADIANEVGVAKIGEPRNLWEKGNYREAIYAVESWYSFHSIEDYANNIRSIQNAFFGSRDGKTEAKHSLAAYLKTHDAPLYEKTKSQIQTAINAIESMAAPFRSHIGNSSVLAAQDACSHLEKIISNSLKPLITGLSEREEEELKNIVANYVDNVVLPTYQDLAVSNTKLAEAVSTLKAKPTNAHIKAAAEAWLHARAPWEKSEAFLFGPVDQEGLDPNMDSWPLDQAAIQNILETGNFEELIYGPEAGKDAIEFAQNVRGFHTLEFLLFKEGQPRTLPF